MTNCTTSYNGVDKFTYNLQYYNFENDEVLEKGQTDLDNLIKEFRNFPWKAQVSKLYAPDAKSNPTIGIKDNLNNYDFGITAYPDDSLNVVFVIYYSYISDHQWEESFREGYEISSVEKAIELFFNRDHEALPNYLIENSKSEFGVPIGL